MAIPGLSSGLPGLGQSLASPELSTAEDGQSKARKVQTHSATAETEYRFEASWASPLSIKLLSGTAELFGTELAPATPYTFRGTKAAIFTWHGCELEITGTPEIAYGAQETTMMQAANVHFALEDMRASAEQSRGQGPRVMLIGPESAGKTSLAKILTGYALKMGRQPVLVNLDPQQGLLSMPGSLTATTMATLIDVEEGWGSSPISGPSAVPVKMPLCYHFGCQEPDNNTKLYKALITRLGLAVATRLEDDDQAKASGCIIDTPSSFSSGKMEDYELIQQVVSDFSIDIILVLGSERLYSEIKRRFSMPTAYKTINVIRLDKSGGSIDRTESYMKHFRQSQIRQYFYGIINMSLNPFTQLVGFDEVTIYRINDGSPSSAFDPGADDDDEEEDYQPAPVSSASHEKVAPSMALQNIILAVTHADSGDNVDRIRDASVMWYVYVAEVDEKKRRLKVVSPISGRMPKKVLLMGNWPEGVPDLVA